MLEHHLTPQLLSRHAADIQSASFVLLDGNLSPEAILVRYLHIEEGMIYLELSPNELYPLHRAHALHMPVCKAIGTVIC
jgi:hypothetical protein